METYFFSSGPMKTRRNRTVLGSKAGLMTVSGNQLHVSISGAVMTRVGRVSPSFARERSARRFPDDIVTQNGRWRMKS
jgi:hypothetical protein